MSAVVRVTARPLVRPQFVCSEFALYSKVNFVHANYEALMAWYDALSRELEGTSEVMMPAGEFIDIQFDLARSSKGLPLIRPARAADAKYADEGELLYSRNDERAANDAGSRTRGEI